MSIISTNAYAFGSITHKVENDEISNLEVFIIRFQGRPEEQTTIGVEDGVGFISKNGQRVDAPVVMDVKFAEKLARGILATF